MTWACRPAIRLPLAGGMMSVGIPRYRLPWDVLQGEIDDIASRPGVNLHLNTPVQLEGESSPDGGPSLASLRRDYDAVFMGIFASDIPPLEGLPNSETLLSAETIPNLTPNSIVELLQNDHCLLVTPEQAQAWQTE